jgi:sugar/nucleoside kinase (ribokinase family)
MIAVVGSLAWRAAAPAGPAGRGCAIALAATARGARVEVVGRAGDDPDGDALMLALARAGVGHAAVLRDPVRSTPVVVPAPDEADEAALSVHDRPPGPGAMPAPGPRLDPADVALALRYLDSYAVLVLADDVLRDAVTAAVEAAAFAGARLVVLVAPGEPVPLDLPPDATVLAAPDGVDAAETGAFEALVGAYAAALDRGATPEEAFSAATGDTGWEALAPSA